MTLFQVDSRPEPAAIMEVLEAAAGLTEENKRLREQVTELQEDSNKKLEIIRELRSGQLSRQVAEFRRMAGFKAGQDVPHVPTKEALVQHLLPVVEEFFELLEACGCDVAPEDNGCEWVRARVRNLEPHDFVLPDFADALTDLDYTVEGLRQSAGIDGAPIQKAVHQANLLKRGGRVDENGKLQKPEGFRPPDIAEELRKQGWAP